MGAFTFEALEADNERSKRIQMRDEEERVIDNLWQLTMSGEVLNESKWTENATQTLKNFEMKLVKAMRKMGTTAMRIRPICSGHFRAFCILYCHHNDGEYQILFSSWNVKNMS
ncbi:potassium channel subfamily K member 18 [Trichonephila clavata]|uniref:Potassium channel subfamily K member 18 n=1 Tax=Trichonephila clavata TaxID=2740835 RepID=A0A8X6LWA1_TRICU|nr:potassium channel subfamily K member 18 [Trichonephila clavata]